MHGAGDISACVNHSLERKGAFMRYVVLAGRALYAAIFVVASFGHFSQRTIAYAAQQGVPMAALAVPLSGLLALAGGLSVLLGYRARIGAWLLIVFLVPVTVMLHRFWGLPDPVAAQLQQIMFMKNVSMLGGAMVIAYFGAGPLSLDARMSLRAASPVARAAVG
jgi:putative oxidoreductase